MYPSNPLLMIAFVAVTYLANYGVGTALSQLARLRLRTAPERFGVSCALGSIVLSWVGYVASIGRLPWVPGSFCWVAVALGVWFVARGLQRRAEGESLPRRDWLIMGLAIGVALLFAGATQWGQVRYFADGSMLGRMIWPDTLYRNAVMARLLNCDGRPDWPWLAGEAMNGMSILRFTAMLPPLKALSIASTSYQAVALWIGLYGIPVAACALLAFYRALGAPLRTSALAVLLTSFLGNPRWLLNERFAHSPALHWAGGDVFAISVPVLFCTLTLLVIALKERHEGALWLAVFAVVSGMGHVPWKGLALYPGLALWLLVALVRRQQVRQAVILAVAALLGQVVLKLLMGSGSSQGTSLLQAFAPAPTIRALSWAFPFLGEPLRPLLSHLGPTNLMKLFKFASVYLVAVWAYLAGSMWVRMIVVPHAHYFRRDWLRTAEGSFLACVVASAVLLTSVVDFGKLTYAASYYDVFRVLWVPLLLANLAVAAIAVLHKDRLKRGWGIVLVLLFVFYGSWENTQLLLWSRSSLPQSVIRSSQMAALRYLDKQSQPQDIVLINPRDELPQTLPPGQDLMTHHWGYYSGLLNARLWLDNEDMARKFGHAPVWDKRLAQLQQAMKTAPSLRQFVQANRINWIVLQGADKLPEGTTGVREVFRDQDVRVYAVCG